MRGGVYNYLNDKDKLVATDYIEVVEGDKNDGVYHVKYTDDTPDDIFIYPYETGRIYNVKVIEEQLMSDAEKTSAEKTMFDFIKSNISVGRGACKALKGHSDARHWGRNDFVEGGDHFTLEADLGNNIWIITNPTKYDNGGEIHGEVIFVKCEDNERPHKGHYKIAP